MERKSSKINSRKTMLNPNTEIITLFGLQSFFIPTIKRLQQYYNSKPFNPTLTSLEEEMAALFIAKTGNLARGGAIPNERERLELHVE